MSDYPKLDPCPFCGGTTSVHFSPAEHDGYYYFRPASVGCERCGFKKTGLFAVVNNDMELSVKTSNQTLVDWWNRRGGKK